MKRFSQRIGATPPPNLHPEEISAELLAGLWNVVHPVIFAGSDRSDAAGDEWRRRMARVYPFLHWRLNELPGYPSGAINQLEKWFFNGTRDWHEIYDLVDFVPSLFNGSDVQYVAERLNEVLEREGAPYRFVGTELTQITDPAEIAAVEEALKAGDRFAGARSHIVRALQLLGQRPQPDYRNAITEAISAVESTLRILTDKDHATLSAALKDFTAKYPMHGALSSGLNSLYGYTSDEHGLRHALIEAEANAGYAEAKFMVVACAAFMNYLIARTAA